VTWTKLGDEFLPATLDLSDAALRLHVEALVYSNWRLLDLMIPKKAVTRFSGVDTLDATIDELVAEGWWQDSGDFWWIGCRFAEWQRDRVQVEHRRRQLAEAQRRRRRHLIGDHSLCLSCAAKTEPSTDDAPDDAPDDAAVDYGHDPGRDGTGRDGPETDAVHGGEFSAIEAERPPEPAAFCSECYRMQPAWVLDDRGGLCITCDQARRTGGGPNHHQVQPA
jgi:hypothetical protein